MPLFVVRPSRGTWAFFGLVVAGVLGARALRRQEARVVQQDRPASETAHALAGCLLGPNVPWALRDPDEPGALKRWTHHTGSILRAAVGQPQADAWPARCVPIASRLHRALLRASTSPSATRLLAQDVHERLQRMASDRDERFARIDDDQLPARFAALMMQVHGLSQGTRETWNRYLGASSGATLRLAALPRLRGLPNGIEQGVVTAAGTVHGRNAWDGMLHAIELDGAGMRDVVVGAAVPLSEPARGGLLLVWRDDGPALASTGAVPRVIRVPRGTRIEGDVAEYRWDADVRREARALLTLDAGTARVFVSPSDGPVVWSDARVVGPAESLLAAMITPDPAVDADALRASWRVTTLRPRLDDLALEAFSVSATLAAPDATSDVSAAPPPPTVTVGAPEPIRLGVRLPASVYLVETCRAADVGYLVLAHGDLLTALRLDGRTARHATVRAQLPRGARLSLRCDAARALATASPLTLQGPAALFDFSNEATPRGEPIEAPPGGVTNLHALLLVRDGVLAVVSTPGAVRTWRRANALAARDGATWEPVGMAMHLIPAPGVRRAVTRAQAASRGDELTLLVDLAQARRQLSQPNADQPMSPFEELPVAAWEPAGAALLMSSDGGATFTSP